MKDAKTMAYINMYGVLGSLQELCLFSSDAAALIKDQPPVTIVMQVRDGPALTIAFENGKCITSPGASPCEVKMNFSSFEKFNGLIDGTTKPFPSKGFTKLNFLLKVFTPLTELLPRYLRASQEDLADEAFFTASTTMMLYVITEALAQIGNHDKIGRFTAGNRKNGRLCISVKDGPAASLDVQDHTLTAEKKRPEHHDSIMEFANMELARGLFDGKVSAMAAIGSGGICMRGNIANIDNLTRLLDRVVLYLA